MFKRIKNLIELSKAPQESIDNAVKAMKVNQEKLGDGKAVFFGPGTHEEFEEMNREKKGLRGIFGL